MVEAVISRRRWGRDKRSEGDVLNEERSEGDVGVATSMTEEKEGEGREGVTYMGFP